MKRTALQFGAVSDASDVEAVAQVEHAKHDQVLAFLPPGCRRRGPVQFHLVAATDTELIETMLEGTEEFTFGDPQGMREFLAENPGGVMIVASVEFEE